MTQMTPGGAVASPQRPTIDQARLKLRSDIEQTKVVLSKDPSPSTAKLNQIIINTVLSLLGDVVEIDVHDHRSQIGIAGDIDRRLTVVEDMAFEGEGDGISDEMARKIVICASQSLALVGAALESNPTDEAKANLTAHAALCNELIEEFTLDEDDEQEDDQDGDAAEAEN